MNEQEALESFRQRAYMLTQIDSLMKGGAAKKKITDQIGGGMAALLGGVEIVEKGLEVPENFKGPSLLDGAKMEKEVLGFYITWNPIEPYRKQLTSMGLTKFNTLVEKENKSKVYVGGMVTEVLIKQTKKGDSFAIVKLESIQTEECKVIFWPKIYEICKEDLIIDKVIIIFGKIEIEEDVIVTVFADDMILLADYQDV